ncbi:proline-rich domain-containing protein [Streptomyces sp. NPDC059009]|uniref:proline-rich domain-containing protein n=1 Tax=Streptomyces sp. NPDC059009 TaxID=3346694 RepID=UPI0036AFEB4A
MAMVGHGTTGQGSAGGLADAASAPAYLRTGTFVALYALASAAWIGYEIDERHQDAGDFFKALWDPRGELIPWAQTPNDWAMIATGLVVGALALARRRVARGAMMLLAVALIFLSLRELVGLAASDTYRELMTGIDYGKTLIAFRVAGLLLGIAVLAEMARVGRRPLPPFGAPQQQPYGYGYPSYGAPAPQDGYGPAYGSPVPPPMPGHRPHPGNARPGAVAAGVCLLLMGAAALGWLIYRLTQDSVYLVGGSYTADGSDAGDFFRNVVDASHGPSVPYTFHTVALVVAPLLVGILLLQRRPAARGAALALAFMALYIDIRGLVPVFAEGEWDAYFDTTVGTLALLTSFFTALMEAVVIVTLPRVPEE